MKTFTVSFLVLSVLAFTTPSIAFPELPFCPAGGPPGWFNRFTQNHNNNNRHYQNSYHTPQASQPAYYSPQGYTPAYIPASTQTPLTRENYYNRSQRR